MSTPDRPAGALTLAERNPIAVRAAVTAAVTAVVHVLVLLHVLGITKDTEDAIAGAVDAVGLAVLLLWSIKSVTPNAKVIARVTTEGTVVAGDASPIPTGNELWSGAPKGEPGVVEVVATVNPDLVKPAA